MQKNNNSAKSETLSREVSNSLIKLILNGTYPAGSKLPTERYMAEKYGVARHIVREALKRLETLHLLTIRQGSGAVVQDVSLCGGIELITFLLTKEDGRIDKKFLADLIEFNEFISINAVKLAARRITARELRELKKLVRERAGCLDNHQRLQELTLLIDALWVKASHSQYVHLLFNTLRRINNTLEQTFGVSLPSDKNVQIHMEQIIKAIEKKDPEMAGLMAARAFREFKDYLIERKRLRKQG
jgi:GntR family transcriptional regulator, transcriptional repressor for pyruvate dehydrogenase complex